MDGTSFAQEGVGGVKVGAGDGGQGAFAGVDVASIDEEPLGAETLESALCRGAMSTLVGCEGGRFDAVGSVCRERSARVELSDDLEGGSCPVGIVAAVVGVGIRRDVSAVV